MPIDAYSGYSVHTHESGTDYAHSTHAQQQSNMW